MHASSIQTSLQLIDRTTTALEAAALIARDNLAALVIADKGGTPVAVVSAVDVLRLMVPVYVLDDMTLAGVFDEDGAEELARQGSRRTIGELVDNDDVRIYDILKIDADATLVEIAARMAHTRAPVALVKGSEGAEPQFVVLAGVMEAILSYCGPDAAGARA